MHKVLQTESLLDVAKKALEEAVNPEKGFELPWWPIFSNLIGGLRKHELTLITAPTGSGKTEFLANISAQILLSDVHHFVASVETGRTDFCRRILSAICDFQINDGTALDISLAKEIEKKTSLLIKKNSIWFSNCEEKIDAHQMVTHIQKTIEERGIKIAMLDNLNFFMKFSRGSNANEVMDDAIHQFVQLVKKLPVHVIMIMHPRKVGRDNRIEDENEIKGSSTAAQEASNVLLYNRPTKEQVESGIFNWTDREIKFVKIRKRGWNYGKKCYFRYHDAKLREFVPIFKNPGENRSGLYTRRD